MIIMNGFIPDEGKAIALEMFQKIAPLGFDPRTFGYEPKMLHLRHGALTVGPLHRIFKYRYNLQLTNIPRNIVRLCAIEIATTTDHSVKGYYIVILITQKLSKQTNKYHVPS